jgi:hypothetical protein
MRKLTPVYSFTDARFLILNLDTPEQHDMLMDTILEDLDNYTGREAFVLWDAIKESRKACINKKFDQSLSEMKKIASRIFK